VFSVTDFTALLGSGFQRQTFPFLSHQLLTSHNCSSQLTACRLSRLTGNGSWSSFYSLGTDRTENTASNGSSIASLSVPAITWQLLSHCLATGMFAEPFPSNGCLWWPYNSDFRQTCHNMLSMIKVHLSRYSTKDWPLCSLWLKRCRSLSVAKVDIFRNVYKVYVGSEKSEISATFGNFPASGRYVKSKMIKCIVNVRNLSWRMTIVMFTWFYMFLRVKVFVV
jgi:hypothetical protein